MTDEMPQDLPDADRDDAAERTLAVVPHAEKPPADPLIAQTRKTLAEVQKAQSRLVAIAGGALLGAMASAAVAGLVGLRAVADLREAGELQAAANKATIEQFKGMQDALTNAETALAALAAFEGQVGARIDGLGDRLTSDLERVATEATAMQPQIAAAIQSHIDTALAKTEAEVLTILAERPQSAPIPVAKPAAPAAKPVPPPKPRSAVPAAKPKPKPAPKPAPPPFSFP